MLQIKINIVIYELFKGTQAFDSKLISVFSFWQFCLLVVSMPHGYIKLYAFSIYVYVSSEFNTFCF